MGVIITCYSCEVGRIEMEKDDTLLDLFKEGWYILDVNHRQICVPMCPKCNHGFVNVKIGDSFEVEGQKGFVQ